MEDDIRDMFRGCFWTILFIIFVALMLFSCATKREYIEKPVVMEHVKTDTLLLTNFVSKSDTTIIRDSVFVRADGSRDTWHGEWHKSNSNATDTVYRTRIEYKDKPVNLRTKVVVKPSWWERLREDVWWLIGGVLLGSGGVIIFVAKRN